MPRQLYPVDHSGDIENDPPVLETQCFWVRGSDGLLAKHVEQNRTLVFMHVVNAQAAAEEYQARMRAMGQPDFEAWVVGPGFPERHEQNRLAAAAGRALPFPGTPHVASPVAAQVNAKIEAEAALTAVAAENDELRRKLAEAEALLASATAPATEPGASNLGGAYQPGPVDSSGKPKAGEESK